MNGTVLLQRAASALLLASATSALGVRAEPWAVGQEPAAQRQPATASDAQALEQLRRESAEPDLRQRYLRSANALLHRFWNSREQPTLLFAGDSAAGCGVKRVVHPMAFYCPESRQIAMAMDLRRSVRAARGKSERELLLLDLAVLAHEVGHHVNREQGRGPYSGGLAFTAKPEELAADWRTGIFLGWLLAQQVITVDDFTQTANLLFELGDYERIAAQHHGYPKDRFAALTRGLASQVQPGQRLAGGWSADSSETFSRPLALAEGDQPLGRRRYEVRRFEIDRNQQIATNLVGGLLGAASCLWGSQEQCLGMVGQQGKGRALGRYTQRRLELDCNRGSFDVSEDEFERQPLQRDGKGQAVVLAARDCAPAARPLSLW